MPILFAVSPFDGNAICANDDLINLTLLHQKARHIVGNQRGGDFFLLHFPGGKPCPLQDGPCLIHIDMKLFTLFNWPRV